MKRSVGLKMNKNESANSTILNPFEHIVTYDSTSIMEMEDIPISWLVDEYIGPGVTILAGKPKIGKSYLVLQLAKAISSGGTIFGKEVITRSVLYLALEDSLRRAFVDGKADYIVYDGHTARKKFLREAFELGRDMEWLDEGQEGGDEQWTTIKYRLTPEGKKYFGLD